MPLPRTADALPQAPDIGFAAFRLDRHSERRDEAEFVAAWRTDPRARFYVVAGDAPLLRNGEALFAETDAAGLGRFAETLFLGSGPDGPVFAALLAEEAAPALAGRPDVEQANLRALALEARLPPEVLGPLGAAKALLNWHARHRFCANCGQPTRVSASGWRRDCPACEAQHFPRVDPVVIMLARRGDQCLLGRQTRFAPGMYSCLAGFLEPGETAEDCVRRETLEEAGVRVGAVRYLATQPWPFPSSLMMGFHAEALGEEITVDRTELEDARWFSRDEVRRMLERTHPDGLSTPFPFAIAHHLIRAFVEEPA